MIYSYQSVSNFDCLIFSIAKGKNQSIFLQKLVKPYTQRKKRDYKVNYSTFDSQLDNLPSLRSSIDQSDKDKSEGEEFHDIKDLDQS